MFFTSPSSQRLKGNFPNPKVSAGLRGGGTKNTAPRSSSAGSDDVQVRHPTSTFTFMFQHNVIKAAGQRFIKVGEKIAFTVTHGLCTLAATSPGRTFSCLFGKKKEGNAIEVTLNLEQKLCGGKCLVHARGRRSQWADWLETEGRRQQFNKLHVFRRRSAVAFEEREVTE